MPRNKSRFIPELDSDVYEVTDLYWVTCLERSRSVREVERSRSSFVVLLPCGTLRERKSKLRAASLREVRAIRRRPDLLKSSADANKSYQKHNKSNEL
ncbi:hypothetical protein [Nostoc sp.]|uniref:hypothetical protein n=1 Tax=Nostoc sp. TaxID=1180 RepID=UPI002FF546C5